MKTLKAIFICVMALPNESSCFHLRSATLSFKYRHATSMPMTMSSSESSIAGQPRQPRSSRPRRQPGTRSRPTRNRRVTSSSGSSSTATTSEPIQKRQPFDPVELTKIQEENSVAPFLDLRGENSSHNNNCENSENRSSSKVTVDLDTPITYPHFQTRSLDDLFPSSLDLNFSHKFNTCQEFRDDLKQAMRMDVFLGESKNDNLSDKVKEILLHPDSSLQGSWTHLPLSNHSNDSDDDNEDSSSITMLHNYKTTLSMPRLTKVLSTYLGPNAPTGEQFMSTIAQLCNPTALETNSQSSYHWIDIIGIKNRQISHSWHQDTAILPLHTKHIYTVMLGFPPTDEYCGTGVFSHVVNLKYPRVRPPPSANSNNDNNNDDHDYNMLAGDPVLYTPEIAQEYIIRPCYEPGKEILFYRDVDVLHSAPDVAYRSSVMRFMNIG